MPQAGLNQLETAKTPEALPLTQIKISSNMPVQQVLLLLKTSKRCGLTNEEAAIRRQQFGGNKIDSQSAPRLVTIIVRQFQSSVIYMLGFATAISLIMHEYLQASGILVVLAINAAIGAAIEYRAHTSLANLMRLSGATVRVKRDSRELSLPVADLVPGDIVKLAPGERVPADLRVIECATLSIDESAISGESVPVYKEEVSDDDESATSILHQGTLVLSGRTLAAVTATGASATLGKMGRLISEVSNTTTPLEQQLSTLGDDLSKLTLIVCAIIGFIGIAHQQPILSMLQTSVTLAVAAIPEALPLIATLAMAVGIRRMVKFQALIRRLPAVETLGCTTVICTDKTGTLTENKMLATDIVLAEQHLKLSGSGYEPLGELQPAGGTAEDGSNAISSTTIADVESLLTAAALCNDAKLENDPEEGGWHVHGDPTEGALLSAAEKVGLSCKTLKLRYERTGEVPFDLARKRMSTVHKHATNSGTFCFIKGAPETVLRLCTGVLIKQEEHAISDEQLQRFYDENERLADCGLRVLAIACKRVDADLVIADDSIENELTLLGLIGLADSPKPGVKEAIEKCNAAGIKVVMLTGDQSRTASAIGKELGIISGVDVDNACRATELSALSDDEICQMLKSTRILARTSPDAKLKVVRALQFDNEVVAMTGDGVNDAPALKQADIGIAMGANGSQMACESAALVITNDDFGTIVKAIDHGRITYDNIRRCVGYLLTASVTSVMVVALGIFTDSGLLLKPLQLLSLNLIMHVFPALGIVVQTYDRGLMKLPPRSRQARILGRREIMQILLRSTIISVVVLVAVLHGIFIDSHIGTAVLAAVSLNLIMQSWLWLAKPTTPQNLLNGPMILCTLLAIAILAISMYFAPVAQALNCAQLAPDELRSIGIITLIITACTWVLGLLPQNVTKNAARAPS